MTQQQVPQQAQVATTDDVSVKTETAAAGTTLATVGPDGTLTAVPTGQPTVQFATVPGAATAATAGGQQIQYVIQLPATSTSSAGQPFQIQMLPQQFQVIYYEFTCPRGALIVIVVD